MNSFRQQAPSRGFTLIEVILAVGLTALLLSLLSSGMYVVAEDWNRNSSVLDEELDRALTLLQIERALLGAFPHSYTDEETLSRQIYFNGEQSRLSFVSTVSPQRQPEVTAWELGFSADAGVTLRLTPAFTDNPAARLQDQEPTLLLPGYEIEFAYLYQNTDEALVWRQEWRADELLQLPQAIHARLIPLGDGEQELEILAPVRSYQHRSIQPNTAAINAL